MMSNPQKSAPLVKVIALMAISLFSVSLYAQPAEEEPQPITGDPFTLTSCPVSGQKIKQSGEPVIVNHEGREIRLCCKSHVEKFKADPAAYLEKVDAAIIKEQTPYYPLETCVVSGEKLGGMGEPVDYVYNNRLVRFCCPGCIGDFNKDPEKHLKKINAAVIEQQSAGYPLETCVVSGEEFGGTMGEPVEMVVGNRLVKLCCTGCVKKFKEHPAKYMEILNEAARKQGKDAGSEETS